VHSEKAAAPFFFLVSPYYSQRGDSCCSATWVVGGIGNKQEFGSAMVLGTPTLSTLAAWQTLVPLPAIAMPASLDIVGIGVLGALSAGLTLTILNLYKSRRLMRQAQRRVGELEIQLNEVEAALYSESQILLVWRSTETEPHRMAGDMHDSVAVPTTLESFAKFKNWLEPDSVSEILSNLQSLRHSGRAFSIGARTLKGELLEVDGRPAGANATLRFRPLAGGRRELTELSYDASKLAKQVQRLSAILDAAPFPVWIKDPTGLISWVNQAYVAALEATDMQAALRGNSPLFPVDQLDASRANVDIGLIGRGRAVTRGTMFAYNIFERTIDGGIAGYAIDATTLEDAEKELERHIKAHASTLDKLETAIAIFGPDQRLRFYNQAYVQLWDLDSTWLKTQPLDSEILDRLRASRSLPEQANFREWKSKQLQSYTTLEMRESYWYLPDGRSLHVICEQHPFGGVTYLYENLTKEYQLESKYNELFDVQRETLDNLSHAVALFGADARLKLYNPAFERLWDIPTTTVGPSLHADQLSQVVSYSAEARAAWQDIRYGLTVLEGSRKRLEGRFPHVGKSWSYSAVPLPDGNSLVTFTDISDSERAEKALRERAEALEAADRLKSEFLANVSYEIRTPLTSIAGFAETLDLGIAGQLSAKQREYILDIRRSSAELASIIDAIIDLSAIDAGQMELRLARIDVGQTFERVAQRILPSLERRDMAINIEIADDVTSLVADPQRVEQILSHLLSNAIGFSKAQGKITMGARLRGAILQVWVADRGKGIDPDFQPRAFDRFQSKPMAGSHRGPGLGLAIVKSFTELHGGSVSLSSRPNEGTTVVCNFPVAGPQLQAASLRSKGVA
jgi:signal transduction histidine kinase